MERNRRRRRSGTVVEEQRVPKKREEVLQVGHAHVDDDVGLFHIGVAVLHGVDVQRVFDAHGILRAVHVHQR